MTASFTTLEIAQAFETTPRELRKFLRSDSSGITPVGKGRRYALPTSKAQINALAKKFAKWDDARNSAKSDIDAEVTETE